MFVQFFTSESWLDKMTLSTDKFAVVMYYTTYFFLNTRPFSTIDIAVCFARNDFSNVLSAPIISRRKYDGSKYCKIDIRCTITVT